MNQVQRSSYLDRIVTLVWSWHAGLGRCLQLNLFLVGIYICSPENTLAGNLLKDPRLMRTKTPLLLLVAHSFFSPKILLASLYKVC